MSSQVSNLGSCDYVAVDNYDQPMEPPYWYDQPEWIWYNDDGGYDD